MGDHNGQITCDAKGEGGILGNGLRFQGVFVEPQRVPVHLIPHHVHRFGAGGRQRKAHVQDPLRPILKIEKRGNQHLIG